jgi:flagellum-specific peptidoglycan hydrolase FlgJ
MTNKEFIETIGRAAVAEYERFKILPSLTIAQAILESNWGKSLLSQRAFNFFGMKAGTGWKGATYNSKTQEQTRAGQSLPLTLHFVHILMCRQASEGIICFCSIPDTRI